MHGICHIEIPTTDLAKSKAFYENVFGWKVEVDARRRPRRRVHPR
jgi:predicted enzyme related to lactoylglutathione lyase